jgi:mannose-6-phosphate isomerase-like protein (cupin superfamily)
MHAVFKADGLETDSKYSVSEWTVAPYSAGPGVHSHEHSDEVFVVTGGTMSVRVGEQWVEAKTGAFILIPAGLKHDFENRTDAPATVLNLYIPGEFESMMPGIVEWYAKTSGTSSR